MKVRPMTLYFISVTIRYYMRPVETYNFTYLKINITRANTTNIHKLKFASHIKFSNVFDQNGTEFYFLYTSDG